MLKGSGDMMTANEIKSDTIPNINAMLDEIRAEIYDRITYSPYIHTSR